MTPQEYERAGEIFDQLLALPEDARPAALDQACEGNSAIRSQVARMLAADRSAGDSFLARPALEDAARLLPDATVGLPQPGTRIGNYLLGPRIGEGGMGVVYQAEDQRLKRRVAVKILSLPLAGGGADLIRRFQQEARAASLLSHPNIVSIYDADFDQGHYFIAMELVEGRTLRQLISSRSKEADSKAVAEWIGQTASALRAAHEAGMVHRDIKPENIMVRPDGFVKVLDFGLAKLRETSVESGGESALLTRPGHLAGTIQYLSPEQVLGKPVDARSDLFSLGVVAYELVTGVRPFDGPTDGAIFDAIVNRNPPPPSQLRTTVDPELEALILRALEKDPDLRFQTALDLRSTLRRMGRTSSASALLPPAPKPRRTFPWVIAFAAAVAAGAAGWWGGAFFQSAQHAQGSLPRHFERMTFEQGEELYPNLSPDGKQLIYSSASRGKWDIYLQRAGGSAITNLTVDSQSDDTEPALSRDGTKIAFRSERDGGGLFVMEATGENPRRVTQRGHLPAWSPDGGSIVYCDDIFVLPTARATPVSRLHVVNLATGAERELKTADAVQPSWSPHGSRIAYWGLAVGNPNREVFTVGVDGGPPVQVTDHPAVDWNPVWSPSGDELYFISDRGGSTNFWRVRIDERTGRISGEPEPFTTPAAYVKHLSFSADGRKFLYTQALNRTNLFSIDFDPNRLEVSGAPVLVGSANYNVVNFSFSPDEKQIVYDTLGEPREDLWIVNTDGTRRRRLTLDSLNRAPNWSPRGDEIVFFSNRTGKYQEYVIRPDASGLRQLTAVRDSSMQAGIFIEGGSRIAAGITPGGMVLINPKSPIPEPNPEPLRGFDEPFQTTLFFSEARNGVLAGSSVARGDNLLLLYSLSERKLTRLGVTGRRPIWLPGSTSRLIFMRLGDCYLYDLNTRTEKRLFSVAPNLLNLMHFSATGRRIYFTQSIRDADLWMGE